MYPRIMISSYVITFFSYSEIPLAGTSEILVHTQPLISKERFPW